MELARTFALDEARAAAGAALAGGSVLEAVQVAVCFLFEHVHMRQMRTAFDG